MEAAPDVQQKICGDFRKTSLFTRYGSVKPLSASPSSNFLLSADVSKKIDIQTFYPLLP